MNWASKKLPSFSVFGSVSIFNQKIFLKYLIRGEDDHFDARTRKRIVLVTMEFHFSPTQGGYLLCVFSYGFYGGGKMHVVVRCSQDILVGYNLEGEILLDPSEK